MFSHLILRQKIFFVAVLVSGCAAMASPLGRWWECHKADKQIKSTDFKVGDDPRLATCRIPRLLAVLLEEGLPLVVDLPGQGIQEQVRVADVAEAANPAYRVKDNGVLYVNASLLASLQGSSRALSLYARPSAAELWRRAEPYAGVAILLAVVGTLAFWKPARIKVFSPQRRTELDSLRGVAAFFVMLFHSAIMFMPAAWFIVFDRDPHRTPSPWIGEWIKYSPFYMFLKGRLMVDIFWMLSGLVLSMPLLRQDSMVRLSEAFAKRYFRLMPIPLVATLISYCMAAFGGDFHEGYKAVTGFDGGDYSRNYAGAPDLLNALSQGIFLGTEFDSPLWTIAYELVGSLVLFGVIACTMILKRRKVLWWVLLIYLDGIMATKETFAMGCFIVGLLLADFLRENHSPFSSFLRPWHGWLLLGVAIFSGSAYPGWLSAWADLGFRVEMILNTVSGFLFVALAACFPPLMHFLRFRAFQWLGHRSFAFYAIHAVLFYSVGYGVIVLSARWGAPVAVAILSGFAVYLVGLCMVSDFLTTWVDLPSVELANRFSKWALGSGFLHTGPSSSANYEENTHSRFAASENGTSMDLKDHPPPSES